MLKRTTATLCLMLIFLSGLKAQNPNNDRAKWFKEAKFGMMVHWGLYSILGGSYNGHTLPDSTLKHAEGWYAEWAQQRLEVPAKEYQALVKQFNPVNFDADQWIFEAKNAGMKYFVITAKHHDGFALWDSKVSTYDIGSTPYKKDILGDLAKACKKYGVKLGFYYSHCEDWEHPGGATPEWLPRKTDAEFEQYWTQKCLPQISELIHNYNPDLFWFDTWGDEQEKTFISDKRRDQLIALIRKESPKCLINGRISYLNPGDDIDFLEMMDNTYPEKLQTRPWQTAATMVNSWGWHAKDYNWKPANQMLGYLIGNVAKGGNYLLNIGPKPNGEIPAAAIQRLREMGGWLTANGEAVYGTAHVNTPAIKDVYLTQKTTANGEKYVFASIVKPLNTASLVLPFPASAIQTCKLLESDMPISFSEAENNQVSLLLPKNITAPCSGIQVIKILMKN
ncbi:alpha-L-fucosidase [Pedobacter lusitanus]|uniref:alpha-L-fucosidase n=1 Tax=Pedobacter lusitanus TaxID=1503925 RepID=A0A0D0GLW7_9SPHI|nr:alpha-L-fucosidase [Pedobacter lusitanus]KIO75376.1 alpha-L-fucosidase [Pedobacter lusitanus]